VSDFTRSVAAAVRELEGPDGWCRCEADVPAEARIVERLATILDQEVTPELDLNARRVLVRLASYRALLHEGGAWSKSHADAGRRRRQREVEVVVVRRRRVEP
jgi:hypothetical protein